MLTVDPGAAFGSGIHETTRLVLREVDRRVQGDERVLDAGCGSGILAVAALLLGAKDAICVDVDPLAITVTGENAEHNGVSTRVQASTTPVADVAGEFELILANIQAWVLAEMADSLIARLAPRGTLILSGVLAGQEVELAESFTKLGAPTITRENEWVALTFVGSA